MKKYGIDPKWRWDELVHLTRNRVHLEFDITFTDLIYTNTIVPYYTLDRHYHTLFHIEHMLDSVKDFKEISFHDKVLLKWAIWFHDVIYDAKGHIPLTNERASAGMLRDFSEALGFEENDIKTMVDLVLVTSHRGTPQTRLEEIICDLDLKGFAEPWQSQNAPLVRKEFAHVSDEEWQKGRIDFIRSMLDKEYIYHTDLYRETLEDTARHNLAKEIESINHG